MKNFEFNIPTQVFFGEGSISRLGENILKHGNKILLVYGGSSIKSNGVYGAVMEQLTTLNIEHVELNGIRPNPEINSVKQGIELCRKHKLEFILAVGGGSVIDSVKAIAAGYYYQGDPWDFYTGKAIPSKALPLGTVLTLAATGSEMNGFSVVSNDSVNLKLAMGGDLLKPRFSILDPVYTYSVNEYQTASGTADIMSHCFEQYFSAEPGTYLQDRLAESIITTCIHYGPLAVREPRDYEARSNLMWASSVALNGLLSYGKQGDWATHGIEHALSAHFGMTHGIGLAIITPVWMEYILAENTVEKFASYAHHVWHLDISDPQDAAYLAIDKTREFFVKLGIPSSLKEAGIVLTGKLINTLAEEVVLFGKIGNIRLLDKEDVSAILSKI